MDVIRPGAVALALTAAVGASTAIAEQPPAPAQSMSSADVKAKLQRLRDLTIVEVGELLVKNPDELSRCYSMVCPGTEGMRQAVRLSTLVAKAEVAVTKPAPPNACTDRAINANLETLRALKLVTVGQLLREKPLNSANNYDAPRPVDIDKAKAITCERAGKLANLAQDTKGL